MRIADRLLFETKRLFNISDKDKLAIKISSANLNITDSCIEAAFEVLHESLTKKGINCIDFMLDIQNKKKLNKKLCNSYLRIQSTSNMMMRKNIISMSHELR